MRISIIFCLIVVFLGSCAKLKHEQNYYKKRDADMVYSYFYRSLVFMDSQRVKIQDRGYNDDNPANSMGYWHRKRNKISIKSDLQIDSAAACPYRKVEKKFNPTRSADTAYIYTMDTAGNYILCDRADFEGITEEQEIYFGESAWNLVDTNTYLDIKPNADAVLKIPKEIFLAVPLIAFYQYGLITIPENDAVRGYAYAVQPIDSQYNEFYFELKTLKEHWGYAYVDWVYYLWPDGKLCNRKYSYYRAIKFRRFLGKSFPFLKKAYPKKYKYVDFSGHCLCIDKK